MQIVRNQSWHIGTTLADQISAPLLPRVSVRRKKRLSKENVIISRINLESEVRLNMSITSLRALSTKQKIMTQQPFTLVNGYIIQCVQSVIFYTGQKLNGKCFC